MSNEIYINFGLISSVADNLVPCSDMAGEIVAAGEDVKGWRIGDRVCANFSLDHIYGDTNPAIRDTALGGHVHGVLTEFRTFPAHVSMNSSRLKDEHADIFRHFGKSLVAVPDHLSYEEASTLPYVARMKNLSLRLHCVSDVQH